MLRQNGNRIYGVITIDVDFKGDVPLTCAKGVLMLRLKELAKAPIVRKIRVCDTKGGMHIYIYLRETVDFETMINVRREYCDDAMRIEADIRRHNKGLDRFTNTLFYNKKHIENGKVIYESSELCYDLI